MYQTELACNQRLVADNSAATPSRLDAITAPGVYLCHWSGHLLRVMNAGINIGTHPMASMIANRPLWVTRLSDDPAISLGQARMMAANLNLPVNF